VAAVALYQDETGRGSAERRAKFTRSAALTRP
jgi:hypothetical protein